MNGLHVIYSSLRLSPTPRRWCRRLLLVLFLALLCLPLLPQPVRANAEHSAEHRPVTVTVSLGIIDIPHIDEPSETFDVDAYLTLQWNDLSAYKYVKDRKVLSTDGTYRSASTDEAQAVFKEIGWSNILQFTNQIGRREILNSSLWIEPDGSITYDDRFQATFSSEYKLSKYPFDSQRFHIDIETFNLDKTIVEFEASKETIIFYKSPKVQPNEEQVCKLEDWYLDEEIECYVGEYTSKMTGRTYSYVSIDICAQRKTGFHIWKIFLPLLLIIAISWSVFLIWSENVSSRLSISFIGFLTAISFGFFISRSLPMISYLTYMDGFIIGIYVFMTLTVLEVLTTHLLTRKGREAAAAKLNYYSRWLFPANLFLYLIVVAFAFGIIG